MNQRNRATFGRKESGLHHGNTDGMRSGAGQVKTGKDREHRRDWCYRKLVKNA